MTSILKKLLKRIGMGKDCLYNNLTTNPISFNQIFFLYPIHHWILFRPHVPLLKSHVLPLISIIYVKVKDKFRFPDTYFENFSLQNGNIINENISKMIDIKIKEKLIERNDTWEYFLTDEGGLAIAEIINGKAHENKIFDSNIKYFTGELRQNIDELLEEITKLPPEYLRETAIISIK